MLRQPSSIHPITNTFVRTTVPCSIHVTLCQFRLCSADDCRMQADSCLLHRQSGLCFQSPPVEPQQKHISAINVPQRRTEHTLWPRQCFSAQCSLGHHDAVLPSTVRIRHICVASALHWSLQEYSAKVHIVCRPTAVTCDCEQRGTQKHTRCT